MFKYLYSPDQNYHSLFLHVTINNDEISASRRIVERSCLTLSVLNFNRCVITTILHLRKKHLGDFLNKQKKTRAGCTIGP